MLLEIGNRGTIAFNNATSKHLHGRQIILTEIGRGVGRDTRTWYKFAILSPNGIDIGAGIRMRYFQVSEDKVEQVTSFTFN